MAFYVFYAVSLNCPLSLCIVLDSFHRHSESYWFISVWSVSSRNDILVSVYVLLLCNVPAFVSLLSVLLCCCYSLSSSLKRLTFYFRKYAVVFYLLSGLVFRILHYAYLWLGFVCTVFWGTLFFPCLIPLSCFQPATLSVPHTSTSPTVILAPLQHEASTPSSIRAAALPGDLTNFRRVSLSVFSPLMVGCSCPSAVGVFFLIVCVSFSCVSVAMVTCLYISRLVRLLSHFFIQFLRQWKLLWRCSMSRRKP